ncbi:hypothetical protein GCM10023174_23420 [Chelativorans composti]
MKRHRMQSASGAFRLQRENAALDPEGPRAKSVDRRDLCEVDAEKAAGVRPRVHQVLDRVACKHLEEGI